MCQSWHTISSKTFFFPTEICFPTTSSEAVQGGNPRSVWRPPPQEIPAGLAKQKQRSNKKRATKKSSTFVITHFFWGGYSCKRYFIPVLATCQPPTKPTNELKWRFHMMLNSLLFYGLSCTSPGSRCASWTRTCPSRCRRGTILKEKKMTQENEHFVRIYPTGCKSPPRWHEAFLLGNPELNLCSATMLSPGEENDWWSSP